MKTTALPLIVDKCSKIYWIFFAPFILGSKPKNGWFYSTPVSRVSINERNSEGNDFPMIVTQRSVNTNHLYFSAMKKMFLIWGCILPLGLVGQLFPNPATLSTGQGTPGTFDPIWTTSGWFSTPTQNTMALSYVPALISNNCAPGWWVQPNSLPAPINNGNWITSSVNSCNGQAGYISFRLTLNLPPNCNGQNISQQGAYILYLSGYVDNQIVAVNINGVNENIPSLPAGSYSAGNQVNLIVDGPWQTGINYVDVVVYNDGGPYGLLLVANSTASTNADTDGDGVNDLLDVCPCDFGNNALGCTDPVATACDVDLIRSTFLNAGCIELPSCNDDCRMYFVNPQFLSGQAAQDFAATFGANLVSIQSMNENNCLMSSLASAGQGGVIWIGLTDEQNEGNFEWYDGSPQSFTNWASGEPNNDGNEDCVQIYPDGKWNDLPCDIGIAKSIIEVDLCPIVDLSPIQTCQSTIADLVGSATFGSDPYQFNWTAPSIGFSASTMTTSVNIYDSTVVYLSVEDRYECEATDSVLLVANLDFELPENACFTGPVLVGGTTGFNSYLWENGDLNPFRLISSPGVYVCEATQIGSNLIENGDFEDGNCGFTSEYNQINDQGGYIISDTNSVYWWADCPDHTVNGTQMLIGDAACGTNGVNGGASIWCQTVNVAPNTDYIISFWVTNAANTSLSGSNFQIEINGLSVGNTIATSATTCQWNQYYQLWNSGSATVAQICIQEVTMICQGSDFALDDLFFGRVCRQTDTIVYYPQPVVAYSVSTVCEGISSVYTDNSTVDVVTGAAITSWEWNFGDGNSSSLQNPTHLYATENNYGTQLIVTTNQGCTDTIQQAVTVWPLPTVSYSFDTVCFGNPTNLVDLSSISTTNTQNNLSSWNWSFADGSTSTLQDVTHLYNSAGMNTGTVLMVTSNNGCVDSVTLPVWVHDAPIAQFSFQNNCLYDSLFVDASQSVGAVDFNWSFGDGDSAFVASLAHAYPQAANYTVDLAIVNANGCSDTLSQAVVAFPIPQSLYSVLPVCEGVSSVFSENSIVQIVAGDVITNWEWNFGDGTTSSAQNPQFIYTSENVYSSSLIVTTNHGCKDTLSISVTVWPLPQVTFSVTEVCEEFITDFTDLSTISNSNTSNQLAGWSWTFGDGEISDVQDPVHLYNSDGIVTAQLIVTSNHGCIDSLSKEVIVDPKPTADFSGLNLTGCSPICPEMIATSVVNNPASITNYEWIYSDGTTASGANTTRCIENNDDQTAFYDVKLIVTTNQGCKDSLLQSQYIEVYHNPIASFDYSPENPDLINALVQFNNMSLYANSYTWQIGNYENSTLFEPEIEFPFNATNYEIVLAIATNEGCVDTARSILSIADALIYYVPNTFTPDGDEHNNVFLPVFTSGFDPYDFNLQIYNRWGEVIFESKDYQVGWDGTYQDKPVLEGTYTWKIDFVASESDKRFSESGHVNLVR